MSGGLQQVEATLFLMDAADVGSRIRTCASQRLPGLQPGAFNHSATPTRMLQTCSSSSLASGYPPGSTAAPSVMLWIYVHRAFCPSAPRQNRR